MARVKVVVSVGCSLCCKCASCICSTAALQLPRIDFFILEKLLQALREKSGVGELCKIAYQCVSGSLLLFSADSSSGLCAASAGAGGRLATDPGLDTTADAGDLVCKDARIQHN